jgi:hypothetical protein
MLNSLQSQVVTLLRDAVHSARRNKHACRELADRVHRLRDELYAKARVVSQNYVDSVARTLQGIEGSVRRYLVKSIVEQCLQASKYKTKFEQYHSSIDRLMNDLDRSHASAPARAAAPAPRAPLPQITYEPPAPTRAPYNGGRELTSKCTCTYVVFRISCAACETLVATWLTHQLPVCFLLLQLISAHSHSCKVCSASTSCTAVRGKHLTSMPTNNSFSSAFKHCSSAQRNAYRTL